MMNRKYIFCFALVLGNCFSSCAGTSAIAGTSLSDVKIVSPQENVYLPGLGSSIFSEQS
jgi:hypothetical protein